MASICGDIWDTNDRACNNSGMPLSCEKVENLPQVVVYYAVIPTSDYQLDLPTCERNEEILACNNEQTKREKYFAWKLLLDAIEQNFGKNAKFERQSTGKWTCDLCHFSISHSDSVVAVAVANYSVGVDIQRLTLPTNDKVVERVFSPQQAEEYHQIVDKEQRAHYFTRVWAQKESIFKMLNLDNFLQSKPQNYDQFALQKLVKVEEKSYYVAVACQSNCIVKLHKIQLWCQPLSCNC